MYLPCLLTVTGKNTLLPTHTHPNPPRTAYNPADRQQPALRTVGSACCEKRDPGRHPPEPRDTPRNIDRAPTRNGRRARLGEAARTEGRRCTTHDCMPAGARRPPKNMPTLTKPRARAPRVRLRPAPCGDKVGDRGTGRRADLDDVIVPRKLDYRPASAATPVPGIPNPACTLATEGNNGPLPGLPTGLPGRGGAVRTR